jgi:hypothetical protein
MSLFQRIAGIIGSKLQIDVVNAGPQIKNNSGALDMRNAADAAYINVRGADPLIANDFATKNYVDSGAEGGVIRAIRYTIGTGATQDSTNTIPANAFVFEATVEITTPYSGGTTISVGQPGSLTLLQLTSDNLPTSANTYTVFQDTSWGGSALVVRTTIAGGPVAGAGVVLVKYSIPSN